MHLIYRSKNFETQEKDYEFSRRSMLDHWDVGARDMRRTLAKPLWLEPAADGVSLRVFDMTRDESEQTIAATAPVETSGRKP